MKKIIGIVLGVLLLVGVAFFFLSHLSSRKVALESVLPSGPVFYLRATNLSDRIEKFSGTKLFTDFKKIDYKNFAASMGVQREAFEQAKARLVNIFSPENQKMLKALLGQELVIAVYKDDSLKDLQANLPEDAQKVVTQLAENIFIATRVTPDLAAAEALLKFLGQFSQDFKTDTTHYHGSKISILSNKEGSLTLAYVHINDIIVMGLGQKAAKSAIDVLAKKQKALSLDDDFAKHNQNFSESTDTVGFLDIHAIYAMINAHVTQMLKDPKTALYANQFKDSLKQVKGLETLTFANTSGDQISTQANLYFKKDQLDPGMRTVYTCAADENRSAKFVPSDALFYEWSTCLDFSQMFNQYKTQLTAQGQAVGRPVDVNQMIGGYEKMLGLSIDADILPTLGHEFGIYTTDIQTTGSIPIPKLVVFVQITDRDKMTSVINKLLALQPNLRAEQESYDGQVIRFIPIPMVDNFKVSYTFVDNYFLLATNTDILKASLDAAKNSDKSILINTALGSSSGKKNSLFFIQFDRLMGKVSDIVDWASQISKQAKIQRQAFLTGSQKNLDDIKVHNEELNLQIKNKKKILLQLQATPDLTPEMTSQKETVQKDIDALQKEIAANEERVKNIALQIKVYEAKKPKEEADMALAEQFVKPMLHALSNIRYFLTFSKNGDGVLESTTRLKIQ